MLARRIWKLVAQAWLRANDNESAMLTKEEITKILRENYPYLALMRRVYLPRQAVLISL